MNHNFSLVPLFKKVWSVADPEIFSGFKKFNKYKV